MSTQNECSCTEILPPPPMMFCDIPVGRDTSGNFTLSYKGLAVRNDCNRFVAFHEVAESIQLFDVTGLTLPGCDPLIYRVPKQLNEIHKGDLLLIGDCPTQVLYMTAEPTQGGGIKGLTASGEERTYYAPIRLGNCAPYIKVESVLDLCFEDKRQLTERQIALIAALLCCKPRCGGFGAEMISSDLTQNLLSSKEIPDQLPLLLALQQSQCLESYILTRALHGSPRGNSGAIVPRPGAKKD